MSAINEQLKKAQDLSESAKAKKATLSKKVPPAGEQLLVATNLRKVYGGRAVVSEVSLEVREREIVGLLGPNGAGKTTSFYMVAGLVRPDQGSITLKGQDVTELPMHLRARLGLGYLPQEESIFRTLTVEENLMAVLETRKDLNRKERKEKMESLLDRFKITKIKRSQAIALSGGEKRRLTIARSLCMDPDILMLDEPFAGVDPLAVKDIQSIVSELREVDGLSILITDHNVRDTLNIVDKAYLLLEGEVVLQGSREEIANNEMAKARYLGQDFTLS